MHGFQHVYFINKSNTQIRVSNKLVKRVRTWSYDDHDRSR